MSHPDPDNHADSEARRLWEQVAASWPPAGACPPAGDLAAFVEGRLTPAEQATLETHLAACGDCLAAVRNVRAILADASAISAPASVRVAAKSLVSRETASRPVTESVAERVTEPAPRWRIADWLTAGRWIAATAASIAICLVGYRLGTVSFVTQGVVSDPLASNMSFGIFDDVEDEEDLVLLGFASDWTEASP